METVNEILRQKPSRLLLFALPDETALEVTKRMDEHSGGALLIMDQGSIVGILTERDILRRVVGEERLSTSVRVSEVMTREVACCTLDTSVDDTQNLMRQYRIRHLPVVNRQGEVGGILSIGDLNAFHASKQEVEIHFLHKYLYGRA